MTLFENFQQQHKRPRLQSPSDSGTQEEITKDAKIDVHKDNPSTPTIASNSLAVLAEVAQSHSSQSSLPDLIGEKNGDKWGFWVIKGWFVGCTSCTLQTLYAWLVRGLCIGMVGILIYRVLRLSLRCDSWYASDRLGLWGPKPMLLGDLM